MSWKHALTTCLLGLLIVGTTLAADPIKVLIVDGQNNHDWKSTTPVLKQQLEESGLFQVDVATSPPPRRYERLPAEIRCLRCRGQQLQRRRLARGD